MPRIPLVQRYRNATWKTWLGAVLGLSLLLAESFALTHQYDSTAHANGQHCTLCVSAASFGAGAVAVPLHFESPSTAAAVVIAIFAAFVSVTPTRRHARGPPAISF